MQSFQWGFTHLQTLKGHKDTSFKKIFEEDFVVGPIQEQQKRRRRAIQEKKEIFANIRCTLVGDRKVGKSCLLGRLTSGQFGGDYIPDEYEDVYSLNLIVNGRTIGLQLCDTPGERDYFKGQRRGSFTNIDVFLLCCSLVDPESLEHLQKEWLPLIRLHCLDVPIIVVGCKDDLQYEFEMGTLQDPSIKEIISTPQLVELSKKINAANWLTCSALEGDMEYWSGICVTAVQAVFRESDDPVNIVSRSENSNCSVQ